MSDFRLNVNNVVTGLTVTQSALFPSPISTADQATKRNSQRKTKANSILLGCEAGVGLEDVGGCLEDEECVEEYWCNVITSGPGETLLEAARWEEVEGRPESSLSQ